MIHLRASQVHPAELSGLFFCGVVDACPNRVHQGDEADSPLSTSAAPSSSA